MEIFYPNGASVHYKNLYLFHSSFKNSRSLHNTNFRCRTRQNLVVNLVSITFFVHLFMKMGRVWDI